MINFRLATIAAGMLLAFTGAAAAHADPDTTATTSAAPVQVRIYLENDNHNPGTVTVSCGKDGPVLHTALFNDAVGANVVETAKIYREDGGPANAANWPVVYGPVDVPIGGHVNVDLPYVAGTSYNAVAIPKGDPWPATLADIVARLSAKPPTADNSQLFPSGYPTASADCPLPKPPNPCEPKPVGDDLAVVATPTCPPCPGPDVKSDIAVVVPTCVPTSEPTSKPSTEPSTKPSTSTSAPASTVSTTPGGQLPVATSTAGGTPSPTGSTTAVVTTPLAHTGASVAPYAAGAVLLLAAGGGFLVVSRRARRH